VLSLDSYDYHLPAELIAKTPAIPRDSSRLFVYDTKSDTVRFDIFRNVGRYLPKDTLLVMNDTKVLPARLFLTKETGGKIEVLLSLNELRPGDTTVRGIVDRKLLVGARLYFKKRSKFLDVIGQDEQFFIFRPSVGFENLPALLLKEGHTPIPPYIQKTPLSERALRARYQSILAHDGTSVAAPTASLHFTQRVLKDLAVRGMKHAEVTLHAGAGTFAPIGEENFKTKKLFTEYCSVSKATARTVNSALTHGRPVIPVGTTALRTIESFANNHQLQTGEKGTNIFIFPPYEFQIASGLITNFHVPKSSLMLLVDAMLEYKGAKRRILDLYEIAIREKFRFYSFGDAMLII
jgi:S-adenosylmethionine:tRNA ribosyltransferase-isomerase